MQEIMNTTILGLFFGTIGTTIRRNNWMCYKKYIK